MSNSKLQRVCLTPLPEHTGGPATFVGRMSAALAHRGIRVTHDLEDENIDAVLLVGATRDLVGVRRARRRGARIVQRLDGINWIHRRQPTGLRHWFKAQTSNTLLAYTRERQTDHVVFQSQFVQDWWRSEYGDGPPSSVIHNGVDLQHYSPEGSETPPSDRIRILLVEGRLGGGYEVGLANALALAGQLAQEGPVELAIAAQVDEAEVPRHPIPEGVDVEWLGLVGQAELPARYRSAHMLFSADINPACPNAVIEALACGTPVLAFDTGALGELVTPQSGRLVDYGADPWKLDAPDIEGLAAGARELLKHRKELSKGARARAEAAFGLEQMVDRYLASLTPDG